MISADYLKTGLQNKRDQMDSQLLVCVNERLMVEVNTCLTGFLTGLTPTRSGRADTCICSVQHGPIQARFI